MENQNFKEFSSYIDIINTNININNNEINELVVKGIFQLIICLYYLSNNSKIDK